MTPRLRTYELRGQGKKIATKSTQTKTSHCPTKSISKSVAYPLKRRQVKVSFANRYQYLIEGKTHRVLTLFRARPVYFCFFFGFGVSPHITLFFMATKLIGPNLDLQFFKNVNFLDEVTLSGHLPSKRLKVLSKKGSLEGASLTFETGWVLYGTSKAYVCLYPRP